MNLLEVKNLEVHFPIRKGLILERQVNVVKAVDDVSFNVAKGSTYGLVGESGCGKTTLGRALLRLVEPTGGSVHFDGTNLSNLKREEMRRIRVRLQMVFQDPMSSLNPRQTVEAALIEPLKPHGVETDNAALLRKIRGIAPSTNLPIARMPAYWCSAVWENHSAPALMSAWSAKVISDRTGSPARG